MTPDEQWRQVAGYEGLYEVSSSGDVRSIPRPRTKGGILRPSTRRKGYLFVTLYHEGAPKSHDVHRLVAAAFHDVTGDVVRHLNGIKTDNRAENLAWGSYSDNQQDTLRHGTHQKKNQTHCVNGHLFDAANTRVNARGHRRCRACDRDRCYRNYHATKEQAA